MSEAKYTPELVKITGMWFTGQIPDEPEYDDANARLTSQRDALLAACEEAEQAMACGEPSKGNGTFCPEGWAAVMDQLRAAIAKAKGGGDG